MSDGLGVGFGVGWPGVSAPSIPEVAVHLMTTKVSIPMLLYRGRA